MEKKKWAYDFVGEELTRDAVGTSLSVPHQGDLPKARGSCVRKGSERKVGRQYQAADGTGLLEHAPSLE